MSCAHFAARAQAPLKPLQRWQTRDCDALRQDAATSHAFRPGLPEKQVLVEIPDDDARLHTATRLYPPQPYLPPRLPRPRLPGPRPAPGAPGGSHSFSPTRNPAVIPPLGAALDFYGIQLRRASKPTAKGKGERRQADRKKRLPARPPSGGVVLVISPPG